MRLREDNGFWLNSKVFSEEGDKFFRLNAYTPAPKLSPEYYTYWYEQLDRCINGYEVSGERITGHHYFYLNFTQIDIVIKNPLSKSSSKISKNPDFWDGDYDYFWCLEIARNGLLNAHSEARNLLTKKEEKKLESGKYTKEELDELKDDMLYKRLKLRVKPHPDYLDGGFHMIVGKARRKGYSFKNGAICANTYNTVRGIQIIIGAFEKKFLYPQGTMGMTSEFLNFINEHTAWYKSRDSVNKIDHKRASYKVMENGIEVHKGYKSEVFALTFKDNPDAARGKDARLVLLEEAGAFPNLKDAYSAIFPALTAGSYVTGQIIIFGTGGDMGGGTLQYAEMFYSPEAFNLLPFINIWDEEATTTTCGFFHPVTWNLEGFYDEQGNSDVEAALKFELERRENIIKNSSSSIVLDKHIQEFSLRPSESFLISSSNIFPTVEIRNQLNRVNSENLQEKKGTAVQLYRDKGEVKARPDLDNKLKPLYNFKPKETDLTGAVLIYEQPMKDIPFGLYKVGYDPYAQDLGTSLTAIYVYKTLYEVDKTKNIIVAEYVGRPPEADDANEIALMLAEFYNTEVMHENMVGHVKTYFRHKKKLNRLAAQPDKVISKSIKHSTVARVYGIHMTEQLKGDGEKYIKDMLLGVIDYDENGDPIRGIDQIYSIGLLEELLQYNRKVNTDRVMALMMCMFQAKEEDLDKEYKRANSINREDEMIRMLEKMRLN